MQIRAAPSEAMGFARLVWITVPKGPGQRLGDVVHGLGVPVYCQGMALDSLAFRQRQIELFDRYGVLLTEHQRRVLELYLGSDWSLSEIARSQETSRSAVHDL